MQTMDMTQGKPLGLLVRFAVPLFFSNICQSLYAVADSAVVGQFLGVNAFAAVGAAGTVSWMVIDVIIGLTQGFGVLYAQRFGSHDTGALRRAIGSSIWVALVLGAALSLAGVLGAGPMLRAIDTPEELVADATVYLQWLFGGALITMAYNLVGKLLSALGNSRTPLVAVILASVLNVLLDVVFVALFHWGVAGVAAATVTAQLFSFFFCLWKLSSIGEVRLSRRDLRPDRAQVWELLRLGAPLGFRNGIISIGGLFVQRMINSYGTIFVAATAAAMKYFDLMQLVAGALDGAFATYSAQNYGVRDLPRIRAGMKCVRRVALAAAVVTAGLAALFGRQMIGLLVTGTPEEMAQITQIGYENLLVIGAGLIPLYLLYLYRSGLQGMGNALVPMLSGFVELGLRLVSVAFLPLWLGRWGVYMAYAAGWVGAFLLLCLSYYYVLHKRERAFTKDRASS